MVSGLALNPLVGHELAVGPEVRLFVHRLTVPCQNLERRTGLVGLEEALWEDGGISCEIVQSGTIRCGDTVASVPGSYSAQRICTPKVPAFFVRPSERTAEHLAELAEMNAALQQSHTQTLASLPVADGECPPHGLLASVRHRLGAWLTAKL